MSLNYGKEAVQLQSHLEKITFVKKGAYERNTEMRSSRVQMHTCKQREILQRSLRRCKRHYRIEMPMRSPGMPGHRTENVMETRMRVGIAADHGAFALKGQSVRSLHSAGYEVVDFGARRLNPADDYPDFVIPLAKAVATGDVERGIALCGSGVGASIAANKVPGVRAGLIHDAFSARQGVEDDDMNVFCLGGKVIGSALAWELVKTFLAAHFSNAARHRRRVEKVEALEQTTWNPPEPVEVGETEWQCAGGNTGD
jgi:ribose 5-phosphate isomerase B